MNNRGSFPARSGELLRPVRLSADRVACRCDKPPNNGLLLAVGQRWGTATESETQPPPLANLL